MTAARVKTAAPAPKPAALTAIVKPRRRRHRHLVCKSAAVAVGALVAAFIGAVFDNRDCVDIIGGKIEAVNADGSYGLPAQHIGGTIRVTYLMRPHHYCDGEVTDFYRHYSGFHQAGEARATSYAKLWDGTPGKEFNFETFKIVPDGLEGETIYEPIIRRWHNVFQEYLNPIRVTGVVIPFQRLPKPIAVVPGAPPVVPVVPPAPTRLPPDAIKTR